MQGFTVIYGIADLSIEGVEVDAAGIIKRFPILYTPNSYLPSNGEEVAIRQFSDGSYEIAPASFHKLSWP
jgi:hypothetical protein